VTIRPVVGLNAIPPVDAYEIPDAIRTAVCYRTPVDAFPYGTHPSKGLDLDHTEAYDHSPGHPPDQTRTDNLASSKADLDPPRGGASCETRIATSASRRISIRKRASTGPLPLPLATVGSASQSRGNLYEQADEYPILCSILGPGRHDRRSSNRRR
jgi:hypothetical protein